MRARSVALSVFQGPLLRPAYVHYKRRKFFSPAGYGACFGEFKSFEEARAWLPANPEFDHEDHAVEYIDDRLNNVFSYDYPMLLWLGRALDGGATRVLDIGGSVGVHYHAYREYLDLHPGIDWEVVEVPAMVSVGRELAKKAGHSALRFTDDLDGALTGQASLDADVWISAGALQYFEDGRASDLLAKAKVRPRHILLNKMPLYNGEDFVTTQNVNRGAFAPFHVYNRAKYVKDIVAMGYTLRDHWSVQERSMAIPGQPDKTIPTFSGLYFEAV